MSVGLPFVRKEGCRRDGECGSAVGMLASGMGERGLRRNFMERSLEEYVQRKDQDIHLGYAQCDFPSRR